VTTKQEFANPSGSHYDRAYLRTLQTLEAEGFLQAGDELRDITSGSAGISLALIGHLLGFRVRITVPDELPANRIYPMLAYGAQVISAGSGYVPAAAEHQTTEIDSLKIDPAYQLSRPRTRASRAFMFQSSHERLCYLNHSENELSPQAFSAIGQELVQQVTDVPEALLLAIGNWTTIAGIVPVIRQAWPDTQIIGYEGEVTDRPHRNYGTTVLGVRLRYEQAGLLDQRLMVSDQERDEVDYLVNTDRSLADQLGHSSLMGLALAKRLHRHGISGNIVTIAYDQKFRY
jgi:cysteine synthase